MTTLVATSALALVTAGVGALPTQAAEVAPLADDTHTIAQVQGQADVSPVTGASVTTSGVVTAAYPTVICGGEGDDVLLGRPCVLWRLPHLSRAVERCGSLHKTNDGRRLQCCP